MSGREDVFQDAMRRGNSAAWDQMWERAVMYYRQALEEFPQDPQALISLGLALLELGEYEEALQVYLQAARLNPEDPISMEKVAQLSEQTGETDQACEVAMQAAALYLKKGDANKAIENWSLVTRLDPGRVGAHSRLAVMHERLGRKSQAATEYLVIASLLQHQGKKGEALQVVQHAAQLAPTNTQVQQALVMLQNDQPLPMPAQPDFVASSLEISRFRQLEAPKTAQEIDRELDPIQEAHKAAMADLARTLFRLSEDRPEEIEVERRGLEEITRGDGKGRSPGEQSNLIYRLRQAIDFQTQEQYEEAAEELEQVFEMGLDIPAMYFSLGFLYVKTGRLESGIRHLQRAVNQPEFTLGSRLLLGEVLRDRGHLKDAAIEYLEALKIADALVVPPEQAESLRQMYEPLIEVHFQEADDEEHERVSTNIAELLVRSDWRANLEKARRELPAPGPDAPPAPLAEVLTQATSSQIVGALTSIHQYARNGQLRVAMDEAYRALDYAPTYLPLHALMGELLLKQERIEEAVEKFTMVAKAYSSRGDAARAQEYYRRILQLAPMNLETRKHLIDQLVVSGDVDAALKEYLGLAEVYLRLAELDKARETYMTALRFAENVKAGRKWRVRIMHQIADINLQRLDWRQALRVFEQIRELEPEDEKARRSLIDLSLRMGQEDQALDELDKYLAYLFRLGALEQAVGIVESFNQAHPDRPALLSRLAQLYQQVNRPREAVDVWDRIGELHLEAGDRAGAIKSLQAIINLNPPNVAEYRQLLQELTGN